MSFKIFFIPIVIVMIAIRTMHDNDICDGEDFEDGDNDIFFHGYHADFDDDNYL